MQWCIGPWRWISDESGDRYEGPDGTIAAIDFRGLNDQSLPGVDRSGVGLFWIRDSRNIAADWTTIGDGGWHDIKANKRIRDAFPKRAGVRLDAPDLIGLIRQSLAGGDPTGLEFAKPLMPTQHRRMRVCMHMASHSEAFVAGKSAEWNAVRDVIRNDMEDIIERAQKSDHPKRKEHHRRVLDALCEAHGIDDWRHFVKPHRVKDIAGRLPHETTITDDFTRADATGLGTSAEGWSWTSVVAGINIVSNRARSTTNNNSSRAESDLSSADHYAQCDVIQSAATNRSLGPRCRFHASADTGYQGNNNGASTTSYQIVKVVAGVATALATADRGSTVTTRTSRIIITGSSLDLWEDGVSKTTVTDTAITGHLRTGIGKSGTQQTGTQDYDNFSASDGAAGGILYTQLERGLRGVTRGKYTDTRG